MMKKTMLLLVLISVFFSCKQEQVNQFSLTGTVEGLEEGEMIYLYDNSKKKDVDSVSTSQGSFTFSGQVEGPSYYYLLVRRGDDVKYLGLWLENTEISILGDIEHMSDAKVMGSEMQSQQDEYSSQIKYINNQLDSLYALYDPSNAELAKALEAQIDSLGEIENQEKISYIKKNPEKLYSAYLLKRVVRNVSPEKGMEAYNLISEVLKQTEYAKGAKEFLDLNKNLTIGDEVVDLVLPDANGNDVALSSLKGNYVLLDFWASWCNPCRAESPYLRKAYAAFKDKGFEIYAVSIDKSIDNWKEAVAKDEMVWTTVLANGAFDSKPAMMYGVKYIPFNYLIDPDGKIIDMHLRGEALLEKLDALLN